MANATFKKRLIFLVLTLTFSFSSFAQKKGKLKEFSKEFPVFMTQLGEFMMASDNSELKRTYKAFKKINETDGFSEDIKKEIIAISNTMLRKRLRPKPHFDLFLRATFSILEHPKGMSKLSEWTTVVHQLIEESTTKRLLMFYTFSIELIESNSLRNSRAVQWNISTNDYYFGFEISQPYIRFDNPIELVCNSSSGSFSIEGTKGTYWPLLIKWEGNGGSVDWQKHSYNKDTVYATLSDYIINIKKSTVVADSVQFFNHIIFSTPIVGKLINKTAAGKQSEKYPVFFSYSKQIELKDIFPNIDYKGGYRMQGAKFIADGGKYADARIIFRKDGKKVFVTNANRFSIGKDKLSSKSAGVKIFFDNDSIYHANLQFKYINSKRLLQLYRGKGGLSGSPMFNTYHQITMDFERLEWEIDKDYITFGSLPNTANSLANFESVDFYLESRYDTMQGIDAIHPLMLIERYVVAKQEEIFFVEDFAFFVKFPLIQVQHFLIDLANQGFIYYDQNEERITVQASLYRYIMAKSEQGDYDVIQFNSNITTRDITKPAINAALNIDTKDLIIRGVSRIAVSDSQKVSFYPYGGQITMKKNRDFIFNGQIMAGNGRINLFGSDFYFHYDTFKVDLNKIDSVQLSVPVVPYQKDGAGNERLTKVKTVIEAVTGELRIDHTSNKSGLRKDSFPEFPIFKSFYDSYAYYDKSNIFDGVYNREHFSFHLKPFEIDSLENYTGKGLAFAGTFESSGIFPAFDDSLRLQDDYSLGFTRRTPDEGVAIYGGKATYYNDIHLSHKGLKGSGGFEYLTAKAQADEIFFFPDSTNLYTNIFSITEVVLGIEFPSVQNTETYAHFMPYHDRLEVNKRQEEFNFYKGQATFAGNLLLRPAGLIGSGIMSLDKAKVNSTLFTYNANWFEGDTTSLRVFDDGGNVAIKANNIKSHIDIVMREGTFYSNGSNSSDSSYVEFPANQYISYIDQLHWEMDEESFILGDEITNGDGSKFISIQDSLHFMAKTANYSLKDYIIHANGVEEIEVADAVIYPDSGVVTVEKRAIISPLIDATVLADNLTEHHTFKNATVTIQGAHKYTAFGDYTYIDAMNKKQQIFFEEIRVNEDAMTIAQGKVKDEEPFHINSKFDFKGNINLLSNRKHLSFDGYFMLNHACNLFEKEWVKFESEVDPQNISFTLDEVLYNDEEDIISNGIMMSLDSTDLYSTFLSKKDRAIDVDVLKASYTLTYDKKQSAYIIGGPDTLSNYFTLYEKTCKTEGEGVLDMNLDFGRINVTTAGEIQNNIKTDQQDLDLFFFLDFFFSEKAMIFMAKDIYSAPGDDIYDYDGKYAKSLGRIVGKDKGEELMVQLEIYDDFVDFPEELNHTIAFTDVHFDWDKTHKSYIAKGKIGIGNIYNNPINVILDGYILIEKGMNSDELTIYLETDYTVYYFNYKNGVMRAWSNELEFNTEINEVSEGKRRAKQERGRPAYRYQIAPEEAAEKFRQKMKKRY